MTRCGLSRALWMALLGALIGGGLTACATRDAEEAPLRTVGTSPPPATLRAPGPCADLLTMPIENGIVEAAEAVQAGGTLAGGVMADTKVSTDLCRVRLLLTPEPGSAITVEVWLPEAWNNKLMGFGGAGFDGGLSPGAAPTLNKATAEGYAVVATDAGHQAGASIESWVHEQPMRLVDFGHRANHLAAAAARLAVGAHYGSPPRQAYFVGCSNGGRDGLMLASRYPNDYNGIIAGAPAGRYTEIVTQLGWYAAAVQGPGGAPDLQSKLALVHDAVNKQCDAIDGVEDGILENPLQCRFDPAVLQCKGVDGPTCLTEAEVNALRKIYGGTRLSDGTRIIPGPVYGSEGAPDWGAWITTPMGTVIAQEFYRWLVHDDPTWSMSRFDIDRDYALARERVAPIINAEDSDLRTFIDRGGKLLMYQGWYDVAIQPVDTIAYYEAVQRRVGDKGARQVKLFMVPGMGHCAGGPGASAFDMQTVLERWIEDGEVPVRVLATKPGDDEQPLTRPLCVWPQVARYTGSGSIRDAQNFVCVTP